MSTEPAVYSMEIEGRVLVLSIDSPPLNTLSIDVRRGIEAGLTRLTQGEDLAAMIIICRGKTFFAGADIREFDQAPQSPLLPDLLVAIENSRKPIVAAMHGTALGGGLEVALACHARIALGSASMGLPEVKLGLMPGAGGTQRLPRLVGVMAALKMMVTGEAVSADKALSIGLIDRIATDQALLENALLVANEIIAGLAPRRRTGELSVPDVAPIEFDEFRRTHAKAIGRLIAPAAIIDTVQRGIALPLSDALRLERETFLLLRGSDQSKALRYAFFAEREAPRVPDISADTPTLEISKVGIVGAGTMGSGIAICFLTAGFPVALLEQNAKGLEAGVAKIRKAFDRNVETGRMSAASAQQALSHLKPTLSYAELAGSSLVIEAAYEDLGVKKKIFEEVSKVVQPGAILATNTSYLDVDAIASSTSAPESVIGLHFFSPANIMKLLEIVRGKQTSPSVLATALKLAKRVGKVAVVSGVCEGFIGNRMLAARKKKLERMILEGASPYSIDRVAEEFGFAMGPFKVSDLAGLDLGWSENASANPTVRDLLCAANRRGQKTNAGYYDYSEKGQASPSKWVEKTIQDVSDRAGIERKEWPDADILEGLLVPLYEEGKKILADGIALRASDIDVVWVNGYGWPRWRGGPMHWGANRDSRQ